MNTTPTWLVVQFDESFNVNTFNHANMTHCDYNAIFGHGAILKWKNII